MVRKYDRDIPHHVGMVFPSSSASFCIGKFMNPMATVSCSISLSFYLWSPAFQLWMPEILAVDSSCKLFKAASEHGYKMYTRLANRRFGQTDKKRVEVTF